jgi:hypothetical protein
MFAVGPNDFCHSDDEAIPSPTANSVCAPSTLTEVMSPTTGYMTFRPTPKLEKFSMLGIIHYFAAPPPPRPPPRALPPPPRPPRRGTRLPWVRLAVPVEFPLDASGGVVEPLVEPPGFF